MLGSGLLVILLNNVNRLLLFFVGIVIVGVYNNGLWGLSRFSVL